MDEELEKGRIQITSLSIDNRAAVTPWSTHPGHSVENAGRLRHPVVDLPSPSAGVDVGQKRSHHGEVRGEAVVDVLLLHRQVLRRYDAVGSHL